MGSVCGVVGRTWGTFISGAGVRHALWRFVPLSPSAQGRSVSFDSVLPMFITQQLHRPFPKIAPPWLVPAVLSLLNLGSAKSRTVCLVYHNCLLSAS